MNKIILRKSSFSLLIGDSGEEFSFRSCSAPYRLNVASLATYLLVISLLVFTSSHAIAQSINGGDGTSSAAGPGGIGVEGGGNGGDGSPDGYGSAGGGGGGGGGGGNTYSGIGGSGAGVAGAGGSGGLAGIDGTAGAFGLAAGGGGGGGVGRFISTSTSFIQAAPITGGAGGAGGDAIDGLYWGDWGGNAGSGGVGVFGSGFSMTNTSIILGGAGGAGGLGPNADGGNGGNGGAGIAGSNFFLENSGSIIGGAGGVGGDTWGGAGPAHGSGGNGGDGIAGSGFVLINSGSITGGAGGLQGSNGDPTRGHDGDGGAGVHVLTGSATTISNLGGTIAGANAVGGASSGAGILVDSGGLINTVINNGSIIGGLGAYGIFNNGVILTLNNRQGGSSALTYSGNLPTHYNVIINSESNYGKLAVNSGSGTTIFGIYSGSIVRNGTYAAVLSGLTLSNLAISTGTFGSASWHLINSSSDIWDLIISGVYSGPSAANTNQSLVNTASVLQGTYTLQNSVLANSFSYDCNVFGANNVCVSAGGRNTALQAANGLNNTSALLIAAYRLNQNYRIGAYADQNLSVSNPGGTVNLGNNTPLIGLFGAWNERLDGTGVEVKVSAAYGQKNTSITRSVVGSGAIASEAGSGSSTLNSQGAQATAKYGFTVMDKVIVSPYIGVRYTQNNMGGYTESISSSVTAPLTYSALNTNATTALAGVGVSYKVIPDVTAYASAGVETDTNTANGTYSAANGSIGALTPVNFNANPVKTRSTATVGAYYNIQKNQRFGVTGIYRQEPYQAVSTTTVMATYTVGL